MEKMPEILEGFSQVEYLLIFNAIVFGAIAGEYFSGWGNLLRHRHETKFSPIQFAWSAFAFLLLIQNWFGSWPRAKFVNDNALYFYFSLIPLLLFYLMSILMFPEKNDNENQQLDFKKHYDSNSRALFILFGLYLTFTIVGSYIYKDVGNVLAQNIIRSSAIVLCVFAAIFNEKKWIHIIFLIMHYIGLIIFIYQLAR